MSIIHVHQAKQHQAKHNVICCLVLAYYRNLASYFDMQYSVRFAATIAIMGSHFNHIHYAIIFIGYFLLNLLKLNKLGT